MPYTIKSQQIAVKDPDTGEYVGVDLLTEQTTESLLNEINVFANSKKNEITQLGDGKKQVITDEATSQLSAITQLGDGKKQAVTDEATSQLSAITQLGDGKKQAITDEGAAQVSAITQLGDGKKQAITDEGAAQVSAVNAKGREVLESIPNDYTALAKTVESMAYGGFIYDTASGSAASFDNGADGMLIKSLVVKINPVQSGSGTPSPTNFRQINGVYEVNISHSGTDTSNPETMTVNWQSSAGTVYGGTIDVVSGKLIINKISKHLSELTWKKNTTFTCTFNGDGFTERKTGITSYNNPDLLCDTYPWYNSSGNNSISNDIPYQIALSAVSTNSKYIVYVRDERYSTLEAWKASFEDHDPLIVCPLQTPREIQLTPQEVECLAGVNNIWADTGDVTVTYPVDTKTYIDKKIQEAIDGLSGS